MSVVDGFAEPGGRDKGRSREVGAPELAGPRAPRLRLSYLDGLRALAAAYVVGFHAVLGFHAEELTGSWRVLRRLFAFGHEAVAIFIVLSGYCLMLPVIRADARELPLDVGRFVRRRAFRILPPYFATLACSLLLLATVPALRNRTATIWDDSLPGLELGAIASHVLLVHNWSPRWVTQINGPLWSVASEWQIYFFFPLLLLPVWRRFGVAAMLAAAAAVGYAPLLFAPGPAMVAIPWYLLLFGFGMAAAGIGFATQPWAVRLREGTPWGAVSGMLWAACAVSGGVFATLWFALKPVADACVGLATAALLVRLTARAASASRGPLLAVLESWPLVRLGHFSYSLYLTHLPVLALCYLALRPLALSPPAFTMSLLAASMVASLLVAYAFYQAVERRFILNRSG